MKYYISWSGGKDSTASIILAHQNNIKIDKILFSEIMFDRKNNISGELPEHLEFIYRALEIFKSWGYDCKVLKADKDYLDCFYHVRTKSKNKDRNGKYSGFLYGGGCVANKLKVEPIRNYYKSLQDDYIQYVGIALDEPKRLARLDGTRKSLLADFEYTEQMAYDLCKRYNLLSPIYKISKRGGCWFCPNSTYKQLLYIKTQYPYLWDELRKLSYVDNVVSNGFKYGKSFKQVDNELNNILSMPEQLKFF